MTVAPMYKQYAGVEPTGVKRTFGLWDCGHTVSARADARKRERERERERERKRERERASERLTFSQTHEHT
eukprot:442664-Rhodomonas_salina.1